MPVFVARLVFIFSISVNKRIKLKRLLSIGGRRMTKSNKRRMLISSWCSAFHHYLVTSDSGIHHILHSTFADIFLSHWLVRLLKSQQLKDMCKQGFGLVGFWHHRKVPRAPSNTRQSLHGPNYQHHTFTYTKIRQEIKLRVMKSFVEFKASSGSDHLLDTPFPRSNLQPRCFIGQ